MYIIRLVLGLFVWLSWGRVFYLVARCRACLPLKLDLCWSSSWDRFLIDFGRCFLEVLRPSWGHLGRVLGVLAASWGRLGSALGNLRAFLEASLGRLETLPQCSSPARARASRAAA